MVTARPARGAEITVMAEGAPRRATVQGDGNSRSFIFTLVANPARRQIGNTGVAAIDTEGVAWMYGWGAEIEGALRAAYALCDFPKNAEPMIWTKDGDLR